MKAFVYLSLALFLCASPVRSFQDKKPASAYEPVVIPPLVQDFTCRVVADCAYKSQFASGIFSRKLETEGPSRIIWAGNSLAISEDGYIKLSILLMKVPVTTEQPDWLVAVRSFSGTGWHPDTAKLSALEHYPGDELLKEFGLKMAAPKLQFAPQNTEPSPDGRYLSVKTAFVVSTK